MNLDLSILSVDPSLYVTTSLLASAVSCFTSLISGVESVTLSPFLSAKRASLLVLEYSRLILFLIFSSSASVILLGFATEIFAVGSATSYFAVCAFNVIVKAPGSVL